MDNKINILICGLGAIGCIYADKFSKCHETNLKILVDKERLNKYTNQPRLYNDKPLNLEYALPEDTSYKADLILIATKSDGLLGTIKNINNFVGENTVILSLLNGVTSEKLISAQYGQEKVLYSFYIGHTTTRKNNAIYHDGINKIVFGSINNNNSKVQYAENIFKLTDINYKIPKDILFEQWTKFTLNVCCNQISAIYNYTFGQILEDKETLNLVENLSREVIAIAKAEGINNTEKIYPKVLEAIKDMNKNDTTSMLQDVYAKRKTEVDLFSQTLIELGKKHNIPTPYNEMINQKIELIEANY